MAKKPSYAEALRILGHDDSTVLDLAEKLVDGGLGAAGVPDLFGMRGEIVAKGRELLTTIRERVTGVSRWDRTQRIDAAERIMAAVSLLEALDETDPADSDISEEAIGRFTEQILGYGADARVPLVTSHERPSLMIGSQSWAYLLHSSSGLGELGPTILDAAQQRYQESYRQLAAEVPEFGVWANLGEHERTRHDLTTGLTELEELLTRLSPQHRAQQHVQQLHTLYRQPLWRPILSSSEAPDHLTPPTMEQAYINPRARAASAGRQFRPASESWWARATPHEDVQTLLAQCLTQVWCATLPIVILGHPGAGKSKLTEMLAARLPVADFLAVRVELRGVSADAPIRRQIEQAVSDQLHRDVVWRDLVESAPGAQPVVILDGFDELLQATGVNRSDYLEQVQRFQQDQAALGQPVAVVVTSRTVVADRVRFPEGCALIRLEPFSDDQIAHLLDIWGEANTDALATRGLRPLSLDTALRYRELAEQPLLLLMLLLYDADGNALESAVGALSRSELYERMLTMFARREVVKHHPHLPERDVDTAVERELNRLEVAAMAMFSRGRQSVTATELERDLAALLPEGPADRPDDTGFHGVLSEAHQVLGRFFFVHESRAHLDGQEAGVYEFLHATFAEYLVARMVTAALDELADDRRRAARRRFAAPLDDGLLYAITSFTALASRDAVVEFTTETLHRRFDGDPNARDEYRDLLVALFHESPYPAPARSFTGYEPWRSDILTRQASYTANLVTLLVCVCEELKLAELFPDQDAPWQAWRRMANQWRSLSNEAWHGLVDTIRSRHLGFWDGTGSSRIERERGDPVNVGECIGFELSDDLTTRAAITNPYDITVPFDGPTSKLLRSTALRDNGTAARVFLLLGPYLWHVSTDLLTLYSDRDELMAAWNELHDILELRLAPPAHDGPDRVRRYGRLLDNRHLGRLELLVLRQAVDDLDTAGSGELVGPLGALILTVEKYLGNLESIVPGPKLSREHVAPVLERLRPHLTVPEHIEMLLDEHDRAEVDEHTPPGDDAPGNPPRATESDRFGYVSDHPVSPSDATQGPRDRSDRERTDESYPTETRRPRKRGFGSPGSNSGGG